MMTPRHQIDLNLIDSKGRVFGLLEFSVIKAEQKLDPEKQDVSYYDMSNFVYSKEILCKIDVDMLVYEPDSAVTYTYKEIHGNTVATTGTTDFNTAFEYYKNSNLFIESSGETPYHDWCDDISFTKVIASEECSLCFIHSDINIDEDIDEKDKKRYYTFLYGDRSKSIVMTVHFYEDTRTGRKDTSIIYRLITKVDGVVTADIEDKILRPLIEGYNNINLHTIPQQ